MPITVYSHPDAMEPLFPSERGVLREKAFDLLKESATVYGKLHPIVFHSVSRMVRTMNSYYSNLIEGHATHPLDIERALQKQYAHEPAKRALQIESKAHVEVQLLIENRLADGREPKAICSPDFIRWIHAEFYKSLPAEFLQVETKHGHRDTVVPGEFRQAQVEVGRHVAPAADSLPAFLSRFAAAYDPEKLDPLDRIIAVGCSHHRLAWIHPFLDGNGRVTRLFSDSYFRVAQVTGYGLWTISRGLARRRDAYMAELAQADNPRWNDFDGRGNLSERALSQFASFFLDCALDQVRFMSALLELSSIRARAETFARHWSALNKGPTRLGHLLIDTLLKGEVSRGDAIKLLGTAASSARRSISLLLRAGVLESEGPYAPLRLALNTNTAAFLFPNLYPKAIEAEAMTYFDAKVDAAKS